MPVLELSNNKKQSIQKTEEYYNALRTNIQLSGEDIKIVAVTSVQPNEGKSTTSTNLAIAFARAGYTTLLIDADIRNSIMSGVFKSKERITGLTDYVNRPQYSTVVGLLQYNHSNSDDDLISGNDESDDEYKLCV